MSLQQNKLCCLIVRELFGEVAESVTHLLLRGAAPLNRVCPPGVMKQKAKRALAALMHHGLVNFVSQGSLVLYSIDALAVQRILRYPRYLQQMKDNFSDICESIIQELMNHGRLPLSAILFTVGCRVFALDPSKLAVPEIEKHFKLLRKEGFIEQCPRVTDSESYLKNNEELVPSFVSKVVIEVDVKAEAIHERIVSSAADEGDHPDKNILWRISGSRFDAQIRDSIVIEAAVRKTDELGGALVKKMLSDSSSRLHQDPIVGDISFFVLKSDILKLCLNSLAEKLRDYLEVLQSGTLKIVRKIGDSGGGQYAIALKDTVDVLTAYAVRSIVQERHGTKAARVFALMLDNAFVDQEQIQQTALIPAKEAKVLTYILSENHFASVREMRKSVGAGAGAMKSVYLFHVDLPHVVRGLVERCEKSLGNVLCRKEAEVMDSERLMDKKRRVDALLKTLVEQGASQEELKEVDAMITPPERDLVTKVNYVLDKLSSAELEIDSTLLLFQVYLEFDEMAKRKRSSTRGRGRSKRAKAS
ncbi:unnamed protein product [Notodromas monacha]|uniref:DNA-directed RNA polymerase III subunit RPC3 n=1 Tax=Notodromas monacha TaxID=399045 RepID=A0A7R9BDK7_9CRUS|nr:unnamed protein product [Notodromas monacha]CAG0913363.1 unnamed protein product [Notodromas monacha]